MRNEVLSPSRELESINTEIIAQQRVAGKAMFEIGKRLKHVRGNGLVGASWAEYCESINLTVETADRLIEVYEEFSVIKIGQGLEALT
ncbi:hypothetical protein 8F11_92, partial [uncultured Caudovirales phage]